jgi:hypothetical protein
MKIVMGLLMVISGIILGVYVGVWIMLIGGIVQVIEQVRSEHLDAVRVGFGIVQILLAGLTGILSAMFLIIPGMAVLSTD